MKQNKFIECEIRGCITYSDFVEIKSLIENDWGRFDETPELVIFFKGGHDLRLKINKDGITLVHKKTLNRKVGARKEIELKFELNEIISVIEFIGRFGFKKGLFSYCKRYEVKKDDYSFVVKFNTKIGDIFEIDKKITDKINIKEAYKELFNFSKNYGLNVWDKETYENLIEKSWTGVKKEYVVVNEKIHPAIIATVEEIKKLNSFDNKLKKDNETIASVLKKRSNDYSELEKIFKNKSGRELLDRSPSLSTKFVEKISAIIPTYNSFNSLKLTLASINNQKLDAEQKKMVEVKKTVSERERTK